MNTSTHQEIATLAARTLELDGGGRVIRSPQAWRRRDRHNLIGHFDCEFPDLPGVHRIPVTAHFDAAGQILSLVARDPLFGDPIGRAGNLPSGQARSVPEASYYEDLGLWLDDTTGLVWVPGIWGRGKFTFDSAQRLPDRLAEDQGYKGFFDWRIPSVCEFDGLRERAHADRLLGEGRPLEGVGRFITETDASLVWTSDPGQEDWAGVAYQLSRTERGSNSTGVWDQLIRLPIMLVRTALEAD